MKWPEIDPAWRETLRKGAEKLRAAEDIVQTMANFHLAGGSPIAMGLSGLAFVSRLVDTVMPVRYPDEVLIDRGYKPYEHASIGDHIIKWLLEGAYEHSTYKVADVGLIKEYVALGLAVVQYTQAQHLYMKPDADLATLVERHFWKGQDYEVTNKKDSDGNISTVYRELPHDVPAYIGRPSVADVVNMVPPVEPGHAQCIFLYGESGTGKSSMARNVARMVNPNGRLLRFCTSSLGDWDMTAMSQILTVLRPSTVLIDDIHKYLSDDDGISLLLDVMEAMHDMSKESGFLIIGTVMDSTPKRTGMRPGRVDRWIRIPLPDAAFRREILSMYLDHEPDTDMVTATAGLSGAYLKELTKRIKRGSWWRREVADLLISSNSSTLFTVYMGEHVGYMSEVYHQLADFANGSPVTRASIEDACRGLYARDSDIRNMAGRFDNPDVPDPDSTYIIQRLQPGEHDLNPALVAVAVAPKKAPKSSRHAIDDDDYNDEKSATVIDPMPDVMLKSMVNKACVCIFGPGYENDPVVLEILDGGR